MNEISLREHLEKVIELRFQAIEKATLLAAAIAEDQQFERASELSRRLEILNHAHQQAVEVQATYVPRELHSADVEKLKDRIAWLEKIAGIAVFLAAAIPIALNYLRRG